MKPSVVKVSESKFDVQTYLKATQKVLGVDLAKELYVTGLDQNKVANLPVLLAALDNESVKPTAVISDPGHLRNHVFYSFLILCSAKSLLSLSSQTDIKIQSTMTTTADYLAVASGTLNDWHHAITDLTYYSEYELRSILNDIQAILEKDGHKFDGFVKNSQADGTYKLLER